MRGAPAAVADPARRRNDLAWSVTPRLGGGAVYVSDDGRNGWRATPQAAPYGGVLAEVSLLNLPGRTSFTVEGSVQQKARTPEGFVFPTGTQLPATLVLGTTYAVLAYGARYAHTAWPVDPYVGLGFVNGFVLDAPKPSLEFGGFVLVDPPTGEAGVFAEVGAEVSVGGGPLTLGVRTERTALDSVFPLAAIFGGPGPSVSSYGTRYNTTLTFVVGKRFGR